jgi:hypothetical protein
VLEKTRSDLTLTMGQQVLMKRLDQFGQEINTGKKKD